MKSCIWVVDDDHGILEVVQIVLEGAGYDVKTIDSEYLFKEEIQKNKPDLVLLDILLSGADGRDIARQIKNNIITATTPIIMMSADTHLQEKCDEVCADDYIKKPFDIDQLENMVSKYLKADI